MNVVILDARRIAFKGGRDQELPLWLSGLQTWLVYMRIQVRSLARWVRDPALPGTVV